MKIVITTLDCIFTCVQTRHHVETWRSLATAWCNGYVVVYRGRTIWTTKTTSAIRKSGELTWIIIGSDRQPETKHGIEGEIVRFRSGRVRDKDRRSEAMNFGTC